MRELYQTQEEIQSGAFLSPPNDRVPFWRDALNIVFDQDGVRPITGFTRITPRIASQPVCGMHQHSKADEGKKYLFWGDSTRLFAWREDWDTPDLVGEGFDGEYWSFESWGNWVVATNGKDPVQVWRGDQFEPLKHDLRQAKVVTEETEGEIVLRDGDGNEVSERKPLEEDWDEYWLAVEGEPETIEVARIVDDEVKETFEPESVEGDFRPNILINFKNMMVAFSTQPSDGDTPQQIRSCEPDDLETWYPQLSNQAAEIVARDLMSEVRAAVKLPQGVAFFGLNSMHMLSYIGPPLILGQQKTADGVGAFGAHCVTQVNGLVYGFGPEGIFMVSPNGEAEYLDNPTIRQYIVERLDRDYAHRSVVWYDSRQELIIVSYPEIGQKWPKQSVCYSLKTGGWSRLDFAASGASWGRVFPHTSAGGDRGNIFWHGYDEPVGGIPPEAQLYIGFSGEVFIKKAGYGILGYGKAVYGDEPDGRVKWLSHSQ